MVPTHRCAYAAKARAEIAALGAVAMTLLWCACGSPEAAMQGVEPAGCYALATGPISRWRPRALLQAPTSPANGNFYLAPGRTPLRLLAKWGVMLNQDTTQHPFGSANWRVNADRSFTLTSFQVDWGYTMTLVAVNRDSVRGIVRFAGDFGPNGRARVVGHRIPCVALPSLRS